LQNVFNPAPKWQGHFNLQGSDEIGDNKSILHNVYSSRLNSNRGVVNGSGDLVYSLWGRFCSIVSTIYRNPRDHRACSAIGRYNTLIMTSNIESPSLSEVCARVRHLGYVASGRVRLYGEEFEVVSDPFPEEDGIAVHVTTKKDSKVRVLKLPATVLQSVRGKAA
jgi:hypothetical protein